MTRQEQAQVLALQALAWLAADEDRISPFLAQSGIGADELRQRAGENEVLAAVLDFLLSDEPLLLDFAASADQRPEAVMLARGALPGGEMPNWT
ncbi:DUF3572 domain-containing protein [Xinfangfangia sp. D13-10-4-6]|uniref:DUF3572 domain-containing protein n=1 Tax=Pseudogemmobacter hezensis TaxID=2737662 RepID=UPI0015529EC6|nr:DUF3572 domain-containing protein [Pseudogemmobacter hezensis]NPD13914.1 DUF3572 domain-containing protein [Pseudogemmobacter hezensis]